MYLRNRDREWLGTSVESISLSVDAPETTSREDSNAGENAAGEVEKRRPAVHTSGANVPEVKSADEGNPDAFEVSALTGRAAAGRRVEPVTVESGEAAMISRTATVSVAVSAAPSARGGVTVPAEAAVAENAAARKVSGPACGYSFDKILGPVPNAADFVIASTAEAGAENAFASVRYLFTDHWGADYLTTYSGGADSWYADAEKLRSGYGTDNLLCWAATASNILQATGWGVRAYPNEDRILDYFMSKWPDEGGFESVGFDWWIKGEIAPEWKEYYESLPDGGKFFSVTSDFGTLSEEIFDHAAFKTGASIPGSTVLQTIMNYQNYGYLTGLAIYIPVGGLFSYGHAITCWGYEADTSGNVYLYISDSDDSRTETSDRRNAANTLRRVKAEINPVNNCLILSDYSSYYKYHVLGVAGLTGYDPVFESKPESFATAVALTISADDPSVERNATIALAGDKDYYTFTAADSGTAVISVDAIALAAGLSVTLSVFNSAGTVIYAGTAGSFDSTTIDIRRGNTYYVLVGDYATDVAEMSSKAYRLAVSAAYMPEPVLVEVFSSGAVTSSGAFISGAALVAGGNDLMIVSSGGGAELTSIGAGAEQRVLAGGSAVETVIGTLGTQRLDSGAVVSATVISGGVQSVGAGASAADTRIAGGRQIVSGDADGVRISSGGSQELGNGGVASEVFVYNGGVQIVGGGTTLGATVSSGGVQLVRGGRAEATDVRGGTQVISGGAAADTLATLGGAIEVRQGGVASSATVGSTAVMTVANGGVAGGTVIEAGGVLRLEGGAKLSGDTLVAGTIEVAGAANFSETKLTLLVSGRTPGHTAIIDNMASLGRLSFSVEVGAAPASGVYALGANPIAYEGVVTVTASGGSLGALTVNGAFSAGGRVYSLGIGDSALNLSLRELAVSSDVNGNRISDVLLADSTTGAVGAWLDGSSVWRGIGAATGWTALTGGDFNSDGSTDVVLGNADGVIGVWQNGDGSSWRTLGVAGSGWNVYGSGDFSGDGIDDLVLISDDGIVGVWQDGDSACWRTLGVIGGDWEIAGVGDFSGNGVDDLVLRRISDGTVGVWRGGDSAGWRTLGAAGSGWEVACAGDFSGDGVADLALVNRALGIAGIWRDGDASGWMQLAGDYSASGRTVIESGDFNGDGKYDLLVSEASSGMIGYLAGGDLTEFTAISADPGASWRILA